MRFTNHASQVTQTLRTLGGRCGVSLRPRARGWETVHAWKRETTGNVWVHRNGIPCRCRQVSNGRSDMSMCSQRAAWHTEFLPKSLGAEMVKGVVGNLAGCHGQRERAWGRWWTLSTSLLAKRDSETARTRLRPQVTCSPATKGSQSPVLGLVVDLTFNSTAKVSQASTNKSTSILLCRCRPRTTESNDLDTGLTFRRRSYTPHRRGIPLVTQSLHPFPVFPGSGWLDTADNLTHHVHHANLW